MKFEEAVARVSGALEKKGAAVEAEASVAELSKKLDDEKCEDRQSVARDLLEAQRVASETVQAALAAAAFDHGEVASAMNAALDELDKFVLARR